MQSFSFPGRQSSDKQQFSSFPDSHLYQTDRSNGTRLDSGTSVELESNCIPGVSFYCVKQHAR